MNKKSAHEVIAIAEVLRDTYKDFNHHNKKNPLDELIFIICSIKRSEKVYLSSFRTLKREFSSHEKLLEAPIAKMTAIFASAGLQNQKALMIKQILISIMQNFGKPTLNPLKKMTDEECEAFLTGLHGVGKKVARCVMMYALGRQVFPVDTNCWRVSCRLGWINWTCKNKNLTAKDMDSLQSRIPPQLRFSLHVNMVSHGRSVCTLQNPNCHKCVISHYCADNNSRFRHFQGKEKEQRD